MTPTPLLNITFRQVEVSEMTIHFVRRCAARCLPSASGTVSASVLLERPEGANEVATHVRIDIDGVPLVGQGHEVDELLAVSNAFAVVREKLLALAPGPSLRDCGSEGIVHAGAA